MSRRLRAVLVCVIALLPSLAHALDPARRLTQYPLQAWDTRSGLPDDLSAVVAQTRDGYLWVGTNRGLARFDGVRFTVVDAASLAGPVYSLAEASDGTLWIGTSRGLFARRGSQLTAYAGPGQVPHPLVTALAAGPDGSLWIASLAPAQSSNGLTRLKDGRFTSYSAKDGLPGGWIWDLHADADGSLWLAAEPGGLSHFRDGSFRRFGKQHGLSSDGALAVERTRDGTLWVGTANGLNRLRGERFTTYTTKDGLSHDSVITLREDRHGSLWIGTIGGGLNRLQGGAFDSLTTADGLPSAIVRALLEDSEGDLWVGCSGGLLVLRDPPVTVFTAREGLPNDLPRTVMEDDQGALWIGTSGGGLSRLVGGRFTTFTSDDGLPSQRISALQQARDGTLWVGTSHGAASRAGARFRAGPPLVTGLVRAFEEDAAGDLWIATDNAVYRRRGQAAPAPIAGLPPTPYYALRARAGGGMWIGGSSGLFLFEAEAVRATLAEGRSVGVVRSIHRDAQGTLWLAGDSLWRLQDGRLRELGVSHGLPASDLQVVLEDDAGALWLGSTRGLFRARKQELLAYFDGSARGVAWSVYGKAEGMRSAACVTGGGCKTRDGRLWFPTQLGLAMLDPRRLEGDRRPPPLHVEALRIDDVHREPAAQMTLRAGTRRVEIHYTAPSFRAPDRVRFQYRLDGFDPQWIDAGAARVATYTNLPPSDYVFRVRASNAAGRWNEAGAQVRLTLQPFFYETAWFRLLGAAAVVLALGGGYRFRVRSLRERERRLERLVGERTEELRGTVDELRRVQEQLARVSEASPEKLENISSWGTSMASEIAQAIRARQIGVWRFERDELLPVAPGTTKPPSSEELRARPAALAELLTTDGEALVPVVGMTGELRGALVIEGPVVWGELERRLVAGFAQHLGGALDIRRMREQLSATEARQAAARRRMRDEGVETLKLCATCHACYADAATTCALDGAGLDESRLLPFRILGRYRLVSLLGEGGMGSVFEARDEKLGRDVALKVIRPERLSDAVVRFRIEREARTLAQIRHPAVTALYDSGELEDGSAFLVMELLHGSDLAEMLNLHGAGSPLQVARLLRQAGGALVAAHQAGIVHRDVKPANLFLVGEANAFQAKVLDFGLATGTGVDPRLTQTGIVLGTPAYMSPEQAQGLPLDARSDLYSLASVAYEALTGRAAVQGEAASLLIGVLYSEPALLSSLLPGIPSQLDEVFASALAKRPDARPPDLAAWAERAASLLEHLPPHRPQGWPAIPDRARGARRAPASASARTV